MTLLSYVLVLALGQYGPLLGTVAAAPLAFLLLFLPDRPRLAICGFVAGCAGSIITYGFAYWLFGKLAGPTSFGPLSFLAATLSLALPIWNDYKNHVELRDIRESMSKDIATIATPDVMVTGMKVIGYVAGIGVGVYWLVVRSGVH